MSRIHIKNARRRIQVHRDKNGIPRIQGATWLDAIYGLGYMHALDRGTQLLFARAVASGQGAELIADKEELLETDRFFRRIGLHLHLEQEVANLSDRCFNQLAAYCEGVNDGIQSTGRSLPMWATGFQPGTWDQQAVLQVGQLISFGGLAVSQLQNERLLLELIQATGDEEALRELAAPMFDDVDFESLKKVRIASNLSDEALELISDLPRLAGSNAWVVGPQKSASGSALLASDPHLEVNRLPAIWYEAILQWGNGSNGETNEYVMGATLPGCPLFSVARTSKVSWGVTYMKGDTIDFFIEDCRQTSSQWQYRRGHEWHDFQIRKETIGRKGSSAEQLLVFHNDLGMLEGNLDENGPGLHLSVAWTGQTGGGAGAISTWLKMISANSALEAMDIAQSCPQPTLCWVVADREGHIGLQGCGTFPRRHPNHRGVVPVSAWKTDFHWQGTLPREGLPRIYDPDEGFISTANEDIRAAGGPILVTHPVPDYRKRRIDERLRDIAQLTLQDMQDLQYDMVSLQARDLLGVFLPHLEDGPLKQRLSKWDCSYTPDSKDAALFQRFYRNVMIEVFGHEKGIGWRRMIYLSTRSGFSTMVLTMADRVLRLSESRWWQTRDKGELIRKAAAKLSKEPDLAWSELNYFHFTDRFFGTHQVGRLLGYRTRRRAMPGCYATPFQGHVMQTATRESTFAPSYHFVTDMGSDEAWTNLPGGPSESRFSKFYKNDLDRWFNGGYKRLGLDGVPSHDSTPGSEAGSKEPS